MCSKIRLVPLCLLLIALFALPVVADQAKSDPPKNETTAAAAPATEQPTAVSSRCQRCGDGYCARSCENEFTCPADCAPKTAAATRCARCGDGVCARSCENENTCPADCRSTKANASSEPAPKCEAVKKPAEEKKK